MSSRRYLHLLFTLVPALLAVGVVAAALFGDNGLMHRHALRRQLWQVQQDVARLEERNHTLEKEIRLLHESPDAFRSEAAEVLLMAPESSVIYRFHEQSSPPAPSGTSSP